MPTVWYSGDAPAQCPAGHYRQPGKVLIGWKPCSCRGVREAGQLGHHWMKCRAEVDGRECGLEMFDPPCSGESCGTA